MPNCVAYQKTGNRSKLNATGMAACNIKAIQSGMAAPGRPGWKPATRRNRRAKRSTRKNRRNH